jgi:ketosteroid isomerase-like protein
MASTDSPVDVVRAYYARLDSGQADLADLFDPDCLFYFPKFGIGRGMESFSELISGLLTRIKSLQHRQAQLLFIVDGHRVAVEGTTSGEMKDGKTWAGGDTPGGRFSSIFEVRAGLITRMFVYLDPDYAGEDENRFLWGPAAERKW